MAKDPTSLFSCIIRRFGLLTLAGVAGIALHSVNPDLATAQEGYSTTNATASSDALDRLFRDGTQFKPFPPMPAGNGTSSGVQPAAYHASGKNGSASIVNPIGSSSIDSRSLGPDSTLMPSSITDRVAVQYRLNHLTWRQFEGGLQLVWGNQLRAAETDGGRTLAVDLPRRDTSREAAMIIDRSQSLVTYEGSRRCLPEWKTLIRSLDRPISTVNRRELVNVIPMGAAHTSMVKQAAFKMGFQEQQDQEVTESIQLPGTQRPDGPVVLTQTEDGQDVRGPVRVTVLPELGLIILSGPAEDVAKVKAQIDKLIGAASIAQPAAKRINLENAQSEQIAETLQEVYDANYQSSSGPATISAIRQPNSVLVVGQPESIKAVEELIKQFDVETPEDEGAGFKTFKLKYISAADAKVRLDALFGQLTQQSVAEPIPAAPVVTIVDYRSNILVVRASNMFIKQAELLLAELDVESVDEGSREIVRVFPLKNTVAADLALILQDVITGDLVNAPNPVNPSGQVAGQQQGGNQAGGRQVDPNQSSLRSKALALVSGKGELIKSGIMFDVRINAEANSNSLVITASPTSMRLLEELIRQLDRIPDAETQIKVFPIRHGDATRMLDMLDTLFGSQNQQAGQGQGGLSTLPLQAASASDGNTLVNLRFSLDERTNSIIASGPVGDLIVVESLLNRLDEQDLNTRRVAVYRLSNAPVADVADAVNTWLTTRDDILRDGFDLTNPFSQDRRQVVVVPEVVSNSLIVSALPEYYAEIEKVIKALDRRPPMVKVKVMIAEVDLNALEEFGAELSIQDALLFDRGVNLSNPFGNETAKYSGQNLAAQGLSFFGLGTESSREGPGGFVLSAGNESISILMRALEDKQCARILSKPYILTLENLRGRIQDGRKTARITGTNQTNGQSQATYTDVDVGLILEITPRVSPDGTIVLFVDATKSELADTGLTLEEVVGEVRATTLIPDIISTEAQTSIMARSGQTVVFSGLIQESKSHRTTGVPILSDVPFIGPLFKFESDLIQRKELLIIMTPYLITDEQNMEMHNEHEFARMHWCECDVAELYGEVGNDEFFKSGPTPVIYYPDADPTGSQPVQSGLESGQLNGDSTYPQAERQQGSGIRPANFRSIGTDTPGTRGSYDNRTGNLPLSATSENTIKQLDVAGSRAVSPAQLPPSYGDGDYDGDY